MYYFNYIIIRISMQHVIYTIASNVHKATRINKYWEMRGWDGGKTFDNASCWDIWRLMAQF
jgi:hypothetical protein